MVETQLIHGDCLEELPKLEANSVDLVLCDPPYGTTHLEWDSVIDFDIMWRELERVRKPNAPVMLFGIEPFSTYLRMSNIKNWHHDVYYRKSRAGNFLHFKNQPAKMIEVISIFNYQANKSTYNHGVPDVGKAVTRHYQKPGACMAKTGMIITIKESRERQKRKGHLKYPENIVSFAKGAACFLVHPTQKPVALLEYLLKIYSNPGDTVLDFTMGSGSTGVACVRTDRNFIGIEIDEKYYDIARERIEGA